MYYGFKGVIVMYRHTEDFLAEWQNAAKGATKAIEAITNEAQDIAIVEGHNTLGWLAWHLVEVGTMFSNVVGCTLPAVKADRDMAHALASYTAMQSAIADKVKTLTNEDLLQPVTLFGSDMPRGQVLRILVNHQTHHVGQMTVLLRQTDLRVPPVMGPTKEMQ